MFGKFVPRRIKKKLRRGITGFRVKQVMSLQKKLLAEAQQKDRIKVAFLLINESIWKYERLYFLLKEDERFEPVVFVCPFKSFGEEVMKKEMEQSYTHFKEQGYEVQKTALKTGEWLDVKAEFNPDLVFFTSPWLSTFQQYSINHFLDVLTGYVPYGFNSSNLYDVHFNFDMQNFCWKVFCETSYHKQLAQQYSMRKGKNFVFTGYPGIDNLIDPNYTQKDVWKKQDKPKKRIIWAPHHTIPTQSNLLDYATFFTFSEFMVEIAEKYKDQIQICFKPHPNLKGKLIKPEVWGTEKTEAYYERWKALPNGQTAEGNYLDLFLGSDALIHDSGSFLLEYLYVDNPVLFMINSEKVKEQFNQLGKKALENMALGYVKEDIVQFIEAVLNEKDDFKAKRRQFVKENLSVPNGELASANMYTYLVEHLTEKKD